MKTTVSGISCGNRTSTRNVGDDVTAEDLWDTYTHIPGAKIIINKMIKAVYHNGFADFNLDRDRLDELQKAHIFRDIFGYSAIAFDGENIQALNPKVQGIGFTMTDFDKDGVCTEITVYNNPNIISGIGIKITDFILLRTPEGLAGPMGLSKLLDLVDTLRIQSEIYTEYAKYAFHQGLAHPLVKIKDLDDTKYNRVQNALSAPTKDDAVIIDIEDDFTYVAPMSNAYDPISMLQYGDTYITRSSELNKLQLYGDPSGVLVASETATANWYASVKEEQDKIIGQIRPILFRLGADEEIQFNDPGEYTMQSQMNGVLLIRQALEGLVEREQIVDMINKFLGLDETEQLIAKKEEEMPIMGEDSEEDNKDIKEEEDDE
jgi:hypothetical protein